MAAFKATLYGGLMPAKNGPAIKSILGLTYHYEYGQNILTRRVRGNQMIAQRDLIFI